MYTKKKDINTKAINIAKKVKDVYLIIVNLRNDYSTYRQDDYKQVNKLCVSRNKILPLKNDNQRVVRIVEDKELVDMVRKEQRVDKSYSSSRNNIRANNIENIKENTDVNKDKIRMNSQVINIKEGVKAINEKKERYVVAIREDIKSDSKTTLGKSDLRRTGLKEELNVKENISMVTEIKLSSKKVREYFRENRKR